MDYYLRANTVGQRAKIELTSARFQSLDEARAGILMIVAIEEAWTNVIENYRELEIDVANATIDDMIAREGDYQRLHDLRLKFGRRLANLLSTTRGYIDQSLHHLGKISKDHAEAFKLASNNAYDASFAYRMMEALRNYSQHRALPVHGISLDSKKVKAEADDEFRLEYSVTMSIDLEALKANSKKMNANFKTELNNWSGKFDALKLVREYIEHLSEVHHVQQTSLKGDRERWSSDFRAAIADYETEEGRAVLGLHAHGPDSAKFPIVASMVERLDILVRRNRRLINLSKRYITTAHQPGKAVQTGA